MFIDPQPPSEAFDNSARAYTHVVATPIASAMGAEISGVDLRDVPDAAVDEIKDALFRHKMVFFRNQQLTDEEQLRFTRQIGPASLDPYADPHDPDCQVTPVVKEADEKQPFVFGGGWHTDSAFMAQPPAITMLRAIDIPPYGGDTMWANAALAYRALSPRMQDILRDMKVHMHSAKFLAINPSLSDYSKGYSTDEVRDQAVAGAFHPLVRTHPETGEKALYLSAMYAQGIRGMTEAEGMMFIDFLMLHINQSMFTCRLKWEKDMVAMWDNRLCQHLAMNDYDGFRREVRRSMVAGEVPA